VWVHDGLLSVNRVMDRPTDEYIASIKRHSNRMIAATQHQLENRAGQGMAITPVLVRPS
jgi:hypothetical protein